MCEYATLDAALHNIEKKKKKKKKKSGIVRWGSRGSRGSRGVQPNLKIACLIINEGDDSLSSFPEDHVDEPASSFDTESQLFLDSALAETGVSSKVRRIVQAIFAAATGVVRIRQQDGGVVMSEPFNIESGVMQGDIFSPVCFIAGLDSFFRLYDQVNPGMTHRPYGEV